MFANRLCLCLLFVVAGSFDRCDDAIADEPEATGKDRRPLQYWIEQLESDQFLRRQSASQRVADFGDEAVKPLAELATRGQLDLTERAIAILQSMALKQSPDDDGGAIGELSSLNENGGGSAATKARSALQSISHEREQQAIERLVNSGVKLGYREFVFDSRPMNENLVQIDSSWNGDVDALRWLRFISGVEFAVLEGPAVNRDVIDHAIRMPDLHTMVIRNATIDGEIFKPLERMRRIDHLEVQYIRLSADDAAMIAKLPIRVQLNLIGTGLDRESTRMLGDAMPGLKIVRKEGGFLGVQRNSLANDCQVDTVVRGGAAERAGIAPGDVIEAINGVETKQFEDLQAEIAQYSPEEEIEIRYNRRGDVTTVKLKLMRMASE